MAVQWWIMVVVLARTLAAGAGAAAAGGGGGGGALVGRKIYSMKDVDSKFFKSDMLLSGEGYRDQLGSSVKLADARSFPALDGLGISMARIDVAPRGFNPPHAHPCVSELMYVTQGSLLVGFVDPNHGNIFQQKLHAGDLFIFPRGLVHFQLNDQDDAYAVALSALNSQLPLVTRIAQQLFAASNTTGLVCE